MLPELSEIKAKRKQLSLSQNELAKKTGISQSLIAKAEAGSLVPSYANAKKIFDFFESIKQESQSNAGELKSTKVFTLQTDSKISDAIKAMKKHNISQLPVVENERVVGTVSESLIVDKMRGEKDLEEFGEKKLSEIMDDAMPQITEQTPAATVSSLLEHNQAVLVVKKGKITGIVSKSDLLGSMLKAKKMPQH